MSFSIDGLAIRPAETPDDFRALQQAQRATWGIDDDTLILPVATMVAAQKFGGLVLGAFRPDGSAAALSFAFVARHRGRIVLNSQLTGVVPSHRSLGLGSRLKERQRAFCREQGIPAMIWTFDPFRPGNARFNLDRLGATCREFFPDLYGPRADALNAGGPTDRLVAEWEIDAAPRLDDTIVAPCEMLEIDDGHVIMLEIDDGHVILRDVPDDAGSAWLAVPASVETLSPSWRSSVREGFRRGFADGFRATSYCAIGDRHGYLLERFG